MLEELINRKVRRVIPTAMNHNKTRNSFSRHKHVLLILLVLSILVIVPPVVRSGEAHPAVSNTNFILYESKGSKAGEEMGIGVSGDTIVMVFPPTFEVRYNGEEEKMFNSEWKPLEDPGNYKYEVESKEWYLTPEPTQICEDGQSRYLISYFVSVSAIPFATKTWWGSIEERVKVVVSASIYIRIDRPPRDPTSKSLSEILRTGQLSVSYEVRIRRTSPSSDYYVVTGTIHLRTDVNIRFYKLNIYTVQVDVKEGSEFGDFDKTGYIMIAPSGDITVYMCLAGPYTPPNEPPFRLEGKLVYRNQFQTAETDVKLDSSSKVCDEFKLVNVSLIPGSYRGNNSLILVFKSGVMEINLRAEVDIYGALVAVSSPVVIAKPEYDEGSKTYVWVIELQVPVTVITHGWGGGSVRADGVVTIAGVDISLNCGTSQFTSSGLYTCEIRSSTPPYNPSTTYSGSAEVTVHLESSNRRISDTVTTDVVLLTHTSIHYVVYNIYAYMVRSLLVLLLVFSLLQVLRPILETLGFRIPFDFVPMILSFSVLLVLVVGLPYFYVMALSTVCSAASSDPGLSEFTRAMGCPVSVAGMSPEDAIAKLFSYYDRLLAKVRSDYVVWVKGTIDEFVWRLTELFIFVTVLIVIAMVLAISMNAPVAGSLASVMMTFGFSIISVLVSLAPTMSMLMAFTSLIEVVITIIVAVLLALLPLGAALSVIPSPNLQVYGENILGAGLFFLMVSPIIAPVSYGLYMHVLKVLEEAICTVRRELILLNVPLFRSFMPPIDLIMKISGYIALSSAILGIVILVHIYFLTKTGLMASIGESLSKILRR